MIAGISYGTYLLFGFLTLIGAAFIWFFVPETKRLTLEEMDVIFGSEGTAQADFERMAEINREIGLDALLRASAPGGHADGRAETPDEKKDVLHHEEAKEVKGE